MVGAPKRRSAVRHLQRRYSVSERRGCEVTGTHRSTCRYESVRPSQAALRQKIRDLAQSRIRYGYKRIHILLRRQGIHVNRQRVHRLYCEEGLQIRARRSRRPVTAASRRPPRTRPQEPNVAWSMDFVSDQLADGRRFRALTVVDVYTRESLAVEPGQSLRGEDLVRVLLSVLAYNLGNLWRRLGLPNRIKSWSLTSLQHRLMKTGGRLIKHARYYWLLLVEGHLNRRLFGDMLHRIWALPLPSG